MPYADNKGVRIHYHVEGEGPPLVLHHGLSADLDVWRTSGHLDQLKADYQLILMDARGHGASDKPHSSEAYAMEHKVGDVVAVLDDLEISSTHFLGYSMGGAVGFGLAKLAPHKVRSLIIGGAGPRGLNPSARDYILDLLEAGPEGGLARLEQLGPVSSEQRERVLANDYKALIANVRSPRFSVEDYLPNMTMPFLLYVGESDGLFPHTEVEEATSRIPNATFVSLPGLDHIQTQRRIDLVMPHVKKFLAQASQA